MSSFMQDLLEQAVRKRFFSRLVYSWLALVVWGFAIFGLGFAVGRLL